MNKTVIGSLIWAGGLIAMALAASWARGEGLVDGETVNRIIMGGIGLMVAWYGNRLPKTVVPHARARQANRIAGWSMALSGMIYAGLWAFAPPDVALFAGCGAIMAGIVVTLAYCLLQRDGKKAA